MPQCSHVYNLYGYRLNTPTQLPCPQVGIDDSLPEIELRQGSASMFNKSRALGGLVAESTKFSERIDVADGSTYVRWFGHFEFLISPEARHIAWRGLNRSTRESLYCHLLGPVLSYAMLAHGVEPLHATTVAIDGKAVAFLGRPGDGKSTLAAAFLHEGHKLLIDDMLVVRRMAGCWLAYPGIPRIKLYNDVSRYLFRGVKGTRMNLWTSKAIFHLRAAHHQSDPIPLHAFYMLTGPSASRRQVKIRRLVGKTALMHLIRHTYNGVVTDPERLLRQLLFCNTIAKEIPIKLLSYPRKKEMLENVVDRIVRDVDRTKSGTDRTASDR